MKRFIFACVAGFLVAACALPVLGQSKGRDRIRYEKKYRDSVLKSMDHEADSLNALNDSISKSIQKECRDKDKKRSDERMIIRFDWSGVKKPASAAVFKAPFHFPPHRQFRTNTCWSFSTTSFFESEIERLSGQEIKLSEMHTVYWEYVEKVLGYIARRGCQAFAPGSESDAVSIIWKKYGVVPYAAYSGLPPGMDKFDEGDMLTEMSRYLEFAKDHNYWDEGIVIGQIRAILDKYMGPPPESFEYAGARYTPMEFLEKVVKLDVDDYVQVMSTLSMPFYMQGRYDVPDNWRPTEDYWNVPLGEYYECITRAAARGYTVAIGGDVSEPGLYVFEGSAVVPTFDIPQEYIDQDSREFRFDNKTSQDDHGVHLLAMTKVGGRDWFLIKDSAASAYWGNNKGYYFYRDDYIKLKMLSFMVHKDVVQFLMPKFEAARKAAQKKAAEESAKK
jgi:bleomycin hydrolase